MWTPDQITSMFELDYTYRRVRAFNPLDLRAMRIRKFEQDIARQFPDYAAYVAQQAEKSYAYTGLAGGRPVIVFGVTPLWAGVAEMWLVADESIVHHARHLLKGGRVFAQACVASLSLHRLQACVQTSNVVAERFINRIGFEREAVLEMYGPSREDFAIWRYRGA